MAKKTLLKTFKPGEPIPLAYYTPKLGEPVTSNGDHTGVLTDNKTVSGVLGAVDREDAPERIFIYNNELNGNSPAYPKHTPDYYGLKYSWDIAIGVKAGAGWIKLHRPFKATLPNIKPWIDKLIADAKPNPPKRTEKLITTLNFLAATNTSEQGTQLEIIKKYLKTLPIASQNKYLEAVRPVRGRLVYCFSPAHVHDCADIDKSTVVPGYFVTFIQGNRIKVQSRDRALEKGLQYIHPNVNSSRYLCTGSWSSGLSTAYRTGDAVAIVQILAGILYGNGEHGFSNWIDYKTQEKRFRDKQKLLTELIEN